MHEEAHGKRMGTKDKIYDRKDEQNVLLLIWMTKEFFKMQRNVVDLGMMSGSQEFIGIIGKGSRNS